MTKIILANQSHLDELARLFDLYRIFYEQEDDFDRAYNFIGQSLYKSLGYEVDEDFFHFSLDIKD